jgi:hypothetical protein
MDELDAELAGCRDSASLEVDAALREADMADELDELALEGCRSKASLEAEAALLDDAALAADVPSDELLDNELAAPDCATAIPMASDEISVKVAINLFIVTPFAS